MLCIAHRGGAGLYPENTLAAFRHAVAIGCDGAELDVQLTRDGEVVVFHDFALNPDICRGRQGSWIEPPTVPVKGLTLRALQKFDVGRARPESTYARAHPGLSPTDGERIPRLAEVIEVAAAAPRPFTLLVELKTSASSHELSADPCALADHTLQVLRDHDFLERALLTSFDWRGLFHAQAKAAVECWFITEPGCRSAANRDTLLRSIASAGGAGWYPNHGDLSAEAVAGAHALGLKVGCWTVNSAPEMQRLIDFGVDAICTDRPDLLAGFLRSQGHGQFTGP